MTILKNQSFELSDRVPVVKLPLEALSISSWSRFECVSMRERLSRRARDGEIPFSPLKMAIPFSPTKRYRNLNQNPPKIKNAKISTKFKTPFSPDFATTPKSPLVRLDLVQIVHNLRYITYGALVDKN